MSALQNFESVLMEGYVRRLCENGRRMSGQDILYSSKKVKPLFCSSSQQTSNVTKDLRASV